MSTFKSPNVKRGGNLNCSTPTTVAFTSQPFYCHTLLLVWHAAGEQGVDNPISQAWALRASTDKLESRKKNIMIKNRVYLWVNRHKD
jgi:hypothetical protein